MASPTSAPSASGACSPDLPDDVMVDGGQLPELSILSPTSHSTVDYKTLDGNWDAGICDSPRSCSSASTSSIGSPVPSYLTRNKSSRAMKPRRNQSAYYDEEQGLWKCRNCGGTYDVPNPGSRQRREHKKACEETIRLKALQLEQEEKARRDDFAIQARGIEEASDRQAVLAGKNPDDLLQNSSPSANKIADDPGDVGALNTTPAIPEKEEVNFGAPKELINNVGLKARESFAAGQPRETQTKDAQLQGNEINAQEAGHGQDGVESDQTKHETETVAAGQLQETYWKDAQLDGGNINGRESRHGQAGAEPDQTEQKATETREQRYRASEQNHPAEDNGPGDTIGSPLKTEPAEELKSVNDSSTPDPNKSLPNRTLDEHWVDRSNPPLVEQVKYCSSAGSNAVHPEGTLYDRLVDLHDDPQVAVTRSVSFSHGKEEASRIASLNHEKEAALGRNFDRSLSLDHYGVEVKTKMDHNSGAAERDDLVEAANGGDRIRELSPDSLVDVLVGKDHSRSSSLNVEALENVSKASSLNGGVEMKQNHSKALVYSFGDDKTGQSPRAAVRTKSYRPQAIASRREQSSSSEAVATSNRQSQSDTPRKGPSNRNESASPQDDDDLGAMVVRNVGKFWKQIASVGAVAVVAWVGKSLAERQQGPRGHGPKCRRGHCAMNNRYYWDD